MDERIPWYTIDLEDQRSPQETLLIRGRGHRFRWEDANDVVCWGYGDIQILVVEDPMGYWLQFADDPKGVTFHVYSGRRDGNGGV